ncbi:MAG: esterase [Ignavibacteriales bacterium]
MISEKHNITTVKTGRYFTLGLKEYGIKKIWFVLHGYGQIAEEFISLFEPLVDDKTMIVAPEALNHFYKKGFSGEVGASWMTNLERENEIKDYLIFLNNIFAKVTSNFFIPKLQVNVLGFSQGTATAIRWVLDRKVIAENLILCGGKIPSNIDFKTCSIISKSTKISYLIGRNDEFISESDINEEKQLLFTNKIDADFYMLNAKHEINAEVVSFIKDKF